MPTQDFLPFAAQAGANVVAQSAWAASSYVGPGFSSGIAPSNECNKAWRQSSIMAAVIGNLIADITGQNVVDDGTTATILANLAQALATQDFGVDTSSTANVYTVTQTPAPAIVDGYRIRFRPAHTNTGASTLTVNGTTHAVVDNGFAAVAANAIIANGSVLVEYNAAAASWVLMDSTGSGVNGSYRPKVVSSALLTWTTTAGGVYTFSHGQGSAPDIVRAVFVNQSAEASYSPGDIVEAASVYVNTGSVGTSVWSNATQIGVSLYNGDNDVVIKTGVSSSAMTAANWKIQLIGIWLH